MRVRGQPGAEALSMWAVVTIPQREAMADALISQLRPPALKILDLSGDVQQNHIRAWREACALGGDWIGVMQDDLILCDDFQAKARRRLAEADTRGYRAVSFYNHAHADPYLVRVHERWAQIDLTRAPGIRREAAGDRMIRSAVPGEQCVAVRRDVALRYDDFAARHHDLYRWFPGVHDGIFGLFLNWALGDVTDLSDLSEAIVTNHVYIALPNLVDHRNDVPSSLELGPPRPRSSSTFRHDAD